MHAERAGGLAVQLEVVHEHAIGSRDAAAEALERELEDPRVGLAHADEGGVDHHLEELVDLAELRAPERLPLANVVREQRGAHAVAAQLADELDHRRVRLEVREVEAAQALQVEVVLEVTLHPRAKLTLADLTALEHEQRVVAVLLGGVGHRPAELPAGHPGLLLIGEEAVLKRRGEHAAEVADERPFAHAAAGGSARTISSYAPMPSRPSR